MPALSVSQLVALRSQPPASKAYLAILAPQVNVIYYGVVTAYVKDDSTGIEYITVTTTSGTFANIANGMTLWAGVTTDDYSLGRVRVKLAYVAMGPLNVIVLAETDEIPFIVGTVISVYQEYLPWVKLPWIAPDGTIEKDHDIGFFVAPNQQTVLWPPVAMMGSVSVGAMNGVVGGIAYVYFDGSASYTTAPSATISSYAWTIYNPDGTVYSTPSAVATPGYLSFVTQGVYIVQLIVTDSNGITSTTRRQMLIVNPANPLQPYYAYTAFDVTRLEGDNDNGWGASFKVHGVSDATYFPEGAQVVLYADDWYGATRNNGYTNATSHGNTFADNASLGSKVWSNPSNALALDRIYATVALNGIDSSHYLFASNFGFALPTNAVILGVVTSIVAHASSAVNGVTDNAIRLFVAGAVAGANNSTTTPLTTTDARYTFGSSTDMWSLALTAAIVNSNNFGVGYVYVSASGTPTVSVDYIDMTVYYYDDTGIGFEAHRSNVKYNGYLLKDSVTLYPQTSIVEFESGSVARVMAQQYMRPTFTQDKATPTTWSESYALTTRRATLYLLYWHSTLLEIMDVFIAPDVGTPIQIADFPKQNFWDMLRNWASSKRFQRPYLSKNGKLTISRDPQVNTLAERNTLPVVMQLQSSDWQGDVRIDESPLNDVAFADVSGVWYEGNPSANGIPIFSKAPGFTPSTYGRDLAVQYLATTGQLVLNALAGNIYQWRNNPYPKVSLKMAGDWVSAFDTGYIEWVQAPASGFVTQRGTLLANARMLVRQMSVSVDNTGGVWTTDITFEAESPTIPSGVIGDYPPGAIGASIESCPLGYTWNNTTRACALLGTTPSQYPWANVFKPNVFAATYLHGIYYTTNFQGVSGGQATWYPLNDGLLGAAQYLTVAGVPYLRQMVSDPYNPTTMYLITDTPEVGASSVLFRFDYLARKWVRVIDAQALMNGQALGGDCSVAIFSTIMVDPKMPKGFVGVFICDTDKPNYRTFFTYSLNYGATWTTAKLVAGSTGINRHHSAQSRGVCGSIQAMVSTNTIYCPLNTDYTNNDNGTLYVSTDTGQTWAASAFTSPTYSFKNGYFFIDPSDQSVVWYSMGTGTQNVVEFTATATVATVKHAGFGAASKYSLDVFYSSVGHGQIIRQFAQGIATLYKTVNEGGVWSFNVPAAPVTNVHAPYGLLTMPDADGKLIMIASVVTTAYPIIWVSEDDGATWKDRSGAGYAVAYPGDGLSVPYDVKVIDVVPIWNVK